MMTKTALVLGSNGRFGRNMLDALNRARWQVRRFERGTSMLDAAKGVDVIVNGLNPAYPDWPRDLPSITRDVIASARDSGATVLIPGNVYNYGTNPDLPWSENTPQEADTRKGKLRIEMEQAYREAGIQTIILRAGDYIDTEVSGNWYESHMSTKLSDGKLMYPGPLNRKHAWGFLPDVARASVALLDMRAELGVFEDIQFPGYTLTGAELVTLLEDKLGRKIKLSGFPWWAIRLSASFWALGRELLEMRYIWEVPHALDGTRIDALLPKFVNTPPEVAFTAVLEPNINPDEAMVRA